jgi:uridine kinase
VAEVRELPVEPPRLALTRLPPARRTLLEAFAGEILAHYPKGRRMVAVDGMSGSGKTTFADDLALALRARDETVFRASADDFHRPKADRYQRGRFSAEGYYRDAFDTATMRRVLLDPFRMGGDTGFVLAAFDLERDAPLVQEWTTGPADAILLVDGVFLQRPELRGLWNYTIWLDVPEDVGVRRIGERDGTDLDPATELNRRHFGAQELYRGEVDPPAAASAIVDARDLDLPRRIFADSC